MKTLDEVLKSYEISYGNKDCSQCPYDNECYDHHVCECYERMDDTFHYLKEYKEQKVAIVMQREDLEREIARYQEAVKRCEEAENKYRILKGELEGFPSNTRMNIRW